MMKNHCLALSISDVGWGEFRRQLKYKIELHGNTLIVADKCFPSSKKCSGCGHEKQNLLLSDREYVCESCGQVIDRDLNAALNLRNYSLKKLGEACPEVTPVETGALTCSSLIGASETAVDEAGILSVPK
jgi:putative transposase